jgi:hypothetical protein
MSLNLNILGTYSFEVSAPAVLGASRFENAKLTGIMAYEDAKLIANIDLIYRQVYPSLPQGTPDTPRLQKYYVFRTQLGEKLVLCEQWILEDSVTEISLVNFTVQFTSQAVETIEQVRSLLVAAGFTSFNIQQSS